MSIILMLLLFAATGCTKSAITVDNEKISKELFDITLKERLSIHKTADREAVKKAVTDELIAHALLVREAKAKKISVKDEEVRKTIEGMRGDMTEQEFKEGLKKREMPYNIFQDRVKSALLISKLMTSLVKDDSVTEEEMRDFYQRRPVPFLQSEQEFVKILEVRNESDAGKAAAELKKGADFDILAKNMSDSGSASVTDYGWLDPDTLPSRELASELKTAGLNVFSGPHKGKDGAYYFFKIKERRGPRELPFEEVKPLIKTNLLNKKRQELTANIIEAGRKTVRIKIDI
ncbi:MAG: peptidyl-prolyl cis-trans isomerase [Nitrospirae bacterium]|nr:peptidyl-prolyl cis-trans isomerase [Nitrospirota bacterium]